MKIAVQMDNIADIDLNGDSTYMLLLEAQKRGYEIHYYTVDKLTLRLDGVFAETQILQLQQGMEDFYKLDKAQETNLATMDVILVRQDPPFNMNYITSTYILEHLPEQVKIVNNPASLRNYSEKLFIFDFPEFITPTIITDDKAQIEKFRQQYENIIIKPLYACGGDGIFFVSKTDKNFNIIIDSLKTIYQTPLMVQSYIKNAERGDKRIILINGKAVGAVLRVPPAGDVRANMHIGGKAVQTSLTSHEEYMCKKIGAKLKELGLYFVGIDVIEGYLTEINVTSPTGIQRINKLNNVSLEAIFWDELFD